MKAHLSEEIYIPPRTWTPEEQAALKAHIASRLSLAEEVKKVVVFGSFLSTTTPRDIDIAVFQDSDEPYLPLALKYRRLIREVGKQIPVDLLPMTSAPAEGIWPDALASGEVIYER